MMQFRMNSVVEKSLIRIQVDQRLLHEDKEAVRLFANESEALQRSKLKGKSPCAGKLVSFCQLVSGLAGTAGWMTVSSYFVSIGYQSDCYEAELSSWIKEALEFLSLDGTIGPLKEATVPITKKLRLE